MKKIFNYLAAIMLLLAVSSCEKADYTLSDSVKHVAFEKSNSSILENSKDTLSIPVYLSTTDGNFNVDLKIKIESIGDIEAIEGTDYIVLSDDVIKLNGKDDIFGYVEIITIDNEDELEDKFLSITVESVSDSKVNIGIGGKENKEHIVTLLENDLPLYKLLLGTYDVSASSYFSRIPYPKWVSVIAPVEGSTTEVDLIDLRYSGVNPIRLTVDNENRTVTINPGQILFTNPDHGDVYVGSLFLDQTGEEDNLVWLPDTPIVVTYSDDKGSITINNYGFHVPAGYFDAIITSIFTKK